MNLPNRYIRYISLVLLVALGLGTTACSDFLSVEENPNNPDREDALSNPGDVESLIGGSFFAAWRGWMHRNPATGTAMGSSMLRSPYSYGCCRWVDMGQEPRTEFKNQASGGYPFNTNAWNDNYSALSSVRDGLQAIDDGLDIGTEDRTKRALAFGKFVQGWATMHIAVIFDRGFVITEHTDLQSGTPELQSYQTLRDSALKFYDRAIEIAQDTRFTLPSNWVKGNAFNSQEFVRLVRSMKVRAWTMTPRSMEERRDVSNGGIVDWGKVAELARTGLREDLVIAGDGIGFNSWGMWSLRQPFQGQSPWGRVSYYHLGPADNSGEFDEWLAIRPEKENPDFFEIETQDKRIVGEPGQGNWRSQGKYFDYTGYGFGSPYAMIRYTTPPRDVRDDSYGDFTGSNQAGPLVVMDHSEMDLMEAEALLRTQASGAKQQVAELINNSRVDVGELPPATSANPVGSPDDRHGNGSPSQGYNQVSLWSMLKYEFYLETMFSVGTIKWSHARGWKDLVKGTPIHFPIPASELSALEKELYTFGGGGPGSAPAGWDR